MKIIYLIILSLITSISYSQEASINGTVKDTNGIGVPGVNIFIEGTNVGCCSRLRNAKEKRNHRCCFGSI